MDDKKQQKIELPSTEGLSEEDLKKMGVKFTRIPEKDWRLYKSPIRKEVKRLLNLYRVSGGYR